MLLIANLIFLIKVQLLRGFKFGPGKIQLPQVSARKECPLEEMTHHRLHHLVEVIQF
jgi:hypothetical protein